MLLPSHNMEQTDEEQTSLINKNASKKPIEVSIECAKNSTSRNKKEAALAMLSMVCKTPMDSGSEDGGDGKCRARKPAKARRKSSTPRKVVVPSDKPCSPPVPGLRKSQRIRVPSKGMDSSPKMGSKKQTARENNRWNNHGTSKPRMRKKKQTAVKKQDVPAVPIKSKSNSVVEECVDDSLESRAENPDEKFNSVELSTEKCEENCKNLKINTAEPDEKSEARADSSEAGEKEPDPSQKRGSRKRSCKSQVRSPLRERSSDEGDSVMGETEESPPKNKKKIVHKKRPCEICGRCYNTFYLKVHMRKHTGEKPFACTECSRSFSTDSLLRTHAQRYHGNTDELHCDVCRKVFASKGSLKIHRQIHSDEKPYKCHLCHKEFKQPGVLNEHLKTHSDDYPFICEVCGKPFKSKRSVFRHKESAHDGIKQSYLCTSCGKVFHDKSSLWRHQKRHEQGYTKHICEVCGKQFHERKVLSTHMLIHENKKPHECEVCGKNFRHYSVLKRHMCCHTGVKPFKCDKCARQFIHRVYMLRHKCSSQNPPKNVDSDAAAEPPAEEKMEAKNVVIIVQDARVPPQHLIVLDQPLAAYEAHHVLDSSSDFPTREAELHTLEPFHEEPQHEMYKDGEVPGYACIEQLEPMADVPCQDVTTCSEYQILDAT